MSEDYARSLCKVVVAQIVRGLGFGAISQSACDALTDIIKLYIEEIGTRAHEYSELASRTDSNFHDVHQAFQDMSVDMNDLSQYLLHADEIPFAKTFSPFPIQPNQTINNNNNNQQQQQQQVKLNSSINGVDKKSKKDDDDDKDKDDKDEKDDKDDKDKDKDDNNNNHNNNNNNNGLNDEPNEYPAHIPNFLPTFPDRHTFSKTPLYGEVLTDPNTLKKTKNKQKRKVEKTLIKLTSITTPSPITSYDLKDQQHSNNNNNNYVDIDNININNKRITPDNVTPTPLQEISSSYYSKHEESSRRSEEIPQRRGLMPEEDNERVKKRQKSERILSLTHENPTTNQQQNQSNNSNNNNNNNTSTPNQQTTPISNNPSTPSI